MNRKNTNRYCRQAFHSAIAIDYSKLNYVVPVKASVQMIVGTVVLWNSPSRMGPFLLGTAVIPIGDQGGALGDKIRGLTVTFISMFLAALLGAICYIYPNAMLPVAFLVSFVTAMAFGPWVFMSGKIITCFFPVIIGMEPQSIGETVAWLSIAGGCVVVWSIVPELLGTYEGLRTDLFQSWNSVGHGISSSVLEGFDEDWEIVNNIHHADPTAGANATRKSLETISNAKIWSNHNEETRNKIQILIKAIDMVRGAFTCILQEKKAVRDEIFQFQRAVGCACIRFAEGCQFSWLVYIPHFKRRIKMAIMAIDEEASNTVAVLTEEGLETQVQLIKSIQSVMQEAAKSFADPWQRGNVPNILKEVSSIAKLPTHSPRKAVWIYCARISVTYTLATIPLFLDVGSPQVQYSHWLPMTVSIISMPGLGSTIMRIIHRTAGTIAGIALGALCMALSRYQVVATILFGATAFGVDVFYYANYGLATIFITAFISLVGAHSNDSIATLTLWRFIFTLSGSGLYLLSMFIWIPKEQDSIGPALAKQARAVHSYAEAVVTVHLQETEQAEPSWDKSGYHFDSTIALFNKRKAATKARLETISCISDTCLTPTWQGRIDPFSLAPAISLELLILISIPVMLDMMRVKNSSRYVSKRALGQLLLLANRLEGIQNVNEAGVQDVDNESADDTTFGRVITRAHRRLNHAGLMNEVQPAND